ncbi:hypothetical protein [Vibrio scophthalmi]|uniref:Glycosyl transferase family 2 n=1 Tax=Vibrio scophthalmi LMG 19158 TaxID=870967 RepID=F9RR29_9VIBR|nr:hypothetical protein [Vibrio scophthalmi]EGU33615.1 glycosyl transferase family 2 [Vibrio scophthalmi LMG 19158]
MLKSEVYVINSFPSIKNEKEGKQQRVKAIDSIISDVSRCYIDLTVRGNFIPRILNVAEGVIEVRLNYFLYSLFVSLFLILKKPVVYVHSVFESVKVIPAFFFSNNIILDLHGVVPEELNLINKNGKSILYRWIEMISVKKSKMNVVVTRKMASHFSKKYRQSEKRFIVVPIFSIITKSSLGKDSKLTAIYAGGMQKWQCIDKMVSFIRNEKRLNYKLYFPSPSDFITSYPDITLMDNVTISTGTPEEIFTEYNKSHFGLIIRDDVVINQVACPTKLIEYINSDLVPIVGDCSIGDFEDLGMKSIHYQNFDYNKLALDSFDNKELKKNLIELSINGKVDLTNLLRDLGL